MFSSGAHHGPYVQFMAVTLQQHRINIGFLSGLGMRIATWFYAMVRALRCQQAIKATLFLVEFISLGINNRMAKAVTNVKGEHGWRGIYTILTVVYPVLKLLLYWNLNTPCVETQYCFSNRAMMFIKMHDEELNDMSLFSDEDTDE